MKNRRYIMAVSGKYGTVSISNIPDDEPVFILRAQDQLANTAIDIYRLLAASHGCQIADSVQKEVEVFQRWPGNKKLPD
jgi:hypothetical protein